MRLRTTKVCSVLLLIATLLSALISCEKTPVSKENINKSNHNQAIEKTSLQVDAEEELYYENISKFVPMLDDNGLSINVHSYRKIGDRFYILYNVLYSGHLTIGEYTIDGQLVSTTDCEESIIGIEYALADPQTLLVVMPDERWNKLQLLKYHADGTLLEESVWIDEPPCQTIESGGPPQLFVLSDDMICMSNGYHLFVFRDGLGENPRRCEMPCQARGLWSYEDDQLLLWGPISAAGKNNFYVLTYQNKVYKSEKFTYSVTVADPRELFPKAVDVWYDDGIFYGICSGGLYVYRDGAPQLLTDWEESCLEADKVTIHQILSDEVYFITYVNGLDRTYDSGFLMRVEQTRTKLRKTVSVASVGLPLKLRKLMRTAVSVFNITNDDYRIYYRDYCDDEYTGKDSGGIIRNSPDNVTLSQDAFKLDLLNGEVFDCYIFPEQTACRKILSDKGLLADLTPLIPTEELFSCATTAYASDGEILALPFFMNIKTLATTQNILPSTKSLTWDVLYGMADALQPGESLFPENPYEDFITVGQNNFVDYNEKSCSFDTDAFAAYAEFTAKIKNGAYVEPLHSVVHGFTPSDIKEQVIAFGELGSQRHITLKHTRFLPFEFNGINSIGAAMYAFKQDNVNYCGFPYENGTAVILSSDALVSMTTLAEHPDGVETFLAFLLSNKVQTCQAVSECGLPVTQEAMRLVFPLGYYNFYTGYAYDGGRYNDPWSDIFPDAIRMKVYYTDEPLSEREKAREYVFDTVFVREEDRDLFLRFLNRAKAITAADATVQSLMQEELSYVTSGVRNGKDAGRILQSRVTMYLNE